MVRETIDQPGAPLLDWCLRGEEIDVQALYRMKSVRQRLEVKLPAGVRFTSQPLRINGTPVTLESGQEGEYYVPLVDQSGGEPFLLELRYTVPSDAARFDLPEFPDEPAAQKVFLCAYLPQEQAVLGARGPWSVVQGWSHQGAYYSKEHVQGDDAPFIAWVSQGISLAGSPTQTLQTDGRLHVYSALRPGAEPADALTLVTLVPVVGLSFAEWRRFGRSITGVMGLPLRLLARLRIRLHAAPETLKSGSGRIEPSLRGRARLGDEPTAKRDKPATAVLVTKRDARRAVARQETLALDTPGECQLPPLGVLTLAPDQSDRQDGNDEALAANARMLEAVLDDFGVRGVIVKVRPGPVVTLYELEPAPGTKSARVISLSDDIARSMSAVSVRVAVIPGRTVIGIELPNAHREMVYLRELLSAPSYESTAADLTLVLGKNIGGDPVITDLARMPHLLVAGTTGSGKSVAINTMILSLLYRLPPDRCKFIMIDPKMLELSVYDGIPHLLAPVVTDANKAVAALKWTVREMESRYKAMSQLGVRNMAGYNKRLKEANARGETLSRQVQTGFDAETGKPIYEEQALPTEPLPYIVVVIDEMADLMLVAGKEVEGALQRLAQMARAAGIHLIIATQRPSVDVITGTIKANFPTRISFQVTSKIDSRTILGEQGAEQLLGQGDMLFMTAAGRIERVHGPFVSDAEVERVARFLKEQASPDYIDQITDEDDDTPILGVTSGGGGNSGEDTLYDQAVALICRERKASTSFVQRHLQIGYNRAARIIERMEAEGVISRANHVGKREVLARDFEDDGIG